MIDLFRPFRRHRLIALAVFLFLLLTSPSWPEQKATKSPAPAQILGFDPAEADIGQQVRMRISSKLSPNFSLVVGGVPVTAVEGDRDPQWVTFTVPSSAFTEETIKVTLIDGGQSSYAPLRIRPMKILGV